MMPLNSHSKWLRRAAAEIACEGHAGWGNTCYDAADEIEQLTAALRPFADAHLKPNPDRWITMHHLRKAHEALQESE